MALIGLTGAGETPARFATSVRAIAPCQIPPLRPYGTSRAAPIPGRTSLTLKRQVETGGKVTLKRQGPIAAISPGAVNDCLTAPGLSRHLGSGRY